MNKRTTEELAKKTMERALKMEQEFGEYFTGEFSYAYPMALKNRKLGRLSMKSAQLRRRY